MGVNDKEDGWEKGAENVHLGLAWRALSSSPAVMGCVFRIAAVLCRTRSVVLTVRVGADVCVGVPALACTISTVVASGGGGGGIPEVLHTFAFAFASGPALALAARPNWRWKLGIRCLITPGLWRCAGTGDGRAAGPVPVSTTSTVTRSRMRLSKRSRRTMALVMFVGQ